MSVRSPGSILQDRHEGLAAAHQAEPNRLRRAPALDLAHERAGEDPEPSIDRSSIRHPDGAGVKLSSRTSRSEYIIM